MAVVVRKWYPGPKFFDGVVRRHGMNYRLTRVQTWLLYVAREGGITFWRTYGSSRYLREQWNLPLHFASPPKIAAAIVELGKMGFIEMSPHSRIASIPAFEECLAEINRGRPPDDEPIREFEPAFVLTPLGGTVWEQIACPDWTRFYNREFPITSDTDGAPEPVIVEALTREIAESALLAHQVTETYLAESAYLKEEVVSPWAPVYWKLFPRGYRILLTERYCQPDEFEREFFGRVHESELKQLHRRIAMAVDRHRCWFSVNLPHPEE